MPLTCAQFEEFLMDYLERRLDGSRLRAFETHIDACAPCRSYLERYRHTVALGQRVCAQSESRVPDSAPHELLTAVLQAIAREGA